MDDPDWLAQRFEDQRGRLRAVAYRMLGSVDEAEDAVQEAWLRLGRSDVSSIANLGGWLTTVVARVCLDQLRRRTARREELRDAYVPDPVVSLDTNVDPETEAVLADSVGLALLVVLETLSPAERLAFVLHDMFDLPFAEIAPVLGRSPDAAKMLASRARRRVRGAGTLPEVDPARSRAAVEAFMAASRDGDFEALLAVLDPDVVLRADDGTAPGNASHVVRGAASVAAGALTFSALSPYARMALVNGTPGIVTIRDGALLAVLGCTVSERGITEIDILADPHRLRRLPLPAFDA